MAPLIVAEARSRLKSNVGAVLLVTFTRKVFTPYLALRAAIVSAIDSFASSPRTAHGSAYVGWIESAITAVLVFNVAQAAYYIQFPSAAAAPPPTGPSTKAIKGLTFVPITKSSPLTRAYPPTPDTPTPPARGAVSSALGASTSQQSPLAQSLYRSTATPTRPSQLSNVAAVATTTTPDRPANASAAPPGSPGLSSETARVLNLAQPGTPSATGLFYDEASPASPAKVARGAAATTAGTASPAPATSSRSDYVVVDREQQEWVDNVWMGVRGKSRRVGL